MPNLVHPPRTKTETDENMARESDNERNDRRTSIGGEPEGVDFTCEHFVTYYSRDPEELYNRLDFALHGRDKLKEELKETREELEERKEEYLNHRRGMTEVLIENEDLKEEVRSSSYYCN